MGRREVTDVMSELSSENMAEKFKLRMWIYFSWVVNNSCNLFLYYDGPLLVSMEF